MPFISRRTFRKPSRTLLGGVEEIEVPFSGGMRFRIDMDLSPLRARLLGAAYIQGVHGSTIGDVCAPDSEILQYAVEQDVLPSAIWGTVVREIAAVRSPLEAGALAANRSGPAPPR
jgi:hypothetical protein